MQLLSFFEASTLCKYECNFEGSAVAQGGSPLWPKLFSLQRLRPYYTTSPLGR